MKLLSKFGLVFSALISAVTFTSTAVYADDHGSKGMNVPKIGSMVVMSGLENPWDMAFTADGSMFYTEKCKGLSVKTASGKVNTQHRRQRVHDERRPNYPSTAETLANRSRHGEQQRERNHVTAERPVHRLG